MSPAQFPIRRPGVEARRILQTRRVEARQAEVDRLKARGTFLRRLVCFLAGHRFWSTGLAGRAPTGTLYALHVCRRCGKRMAEVGPAVTP